MPQDLGCEADLGGELGDGIGFHEGCLMMGIAA